MSDLRAISLTQPWATLVASGAKRFETRHWRTSYRGPIAIHASPRFSPDCQNLCDTWPFNEALANAGYMPRHLFIDDAGDDVWQSWLEILPQGAIVAVAELADIAEINDDLRVHEPIVGSWELEFGDWSDGRYAWCFGAVRRLQVPIPCRGHLGLWRVPAETIAEIDAQLAAPPRPATTSIHECSMTGRPLRSPASEVTVLGISDRPRPGAVSPTSLFEEQ